MNTSLKFYDYYFCLCCILAYWADKELHEKEYNLLKNLYKKIPNNNINNSNISTSMLRDATDIELCFKEYLYWIMSNVEELFYSLNKNSSDFNYSEIETLAFHIVDKLNESFKLNKIKQDVKDVKKSFIGVFNSIIEIDGKVLETEKKLFKAIKNRLQGGFFNKFF